MDIRNIKKNAEKLQVSSGSEEGREGGRGGGGGIIV